MRLTGKCLPTSRMKSIADIGQKDRIALPALVIAGEHDRLTPPDAGRALAAQLPSARFQLVERSGHAPFLSHPQPVLAEVLGFLARHPGEEPA